MKYKLGLIISFILFVAMFAQAGTIVGKVSGAHGVSVVYISAAEGKTFPASTQKHLIDQKGLLFQPHILAVQLGTTVEFLNSDSVAHNVFWPSISGDKKLGHNLGTWPKGEKKPYKFDNPGVVTLLCNVHPEMSGFVVVSPTPYYVTTDAEGNYKIENVPDGKYTITSWHEGMKPQSKPLTVGKETKADFTLSK